MYCTHCGNKLEDNIKCEKCGNYTNEYIKIKKDKPSFILEFISFFVPMFGLIMYLVNKDDKPKRASLCGKMALFGFILSVITSIIVIISIIIHGTQINGITM